MLIVDGLVGSYGSAQVLHGVSFEVGNGEIVALLGRNGMGKTTLIRAIMGMSPPDVTSGRVVWNDAEVTSRPSNVIARRGIGLVPQGRHVFGSLTVEENLTVAAVGGGDGDRGWDLARVNATFPRLRERRRSRARHLSGGEQQMLVVGRALMTNPSLLLLDEPSEGLAPVIVDQLGSILRELGRDGLSLLLVEQNVRLALSVADRVLVLEHGTIKWAGGVEEFKLDAAMQAELLGV